MRFGTQLKRRTISVLCMSMILVSSIMSPVSACTSIFAGKDATSDGSVMISRNEDYYGDWAKHFVVQPRMTYNLNETRTFFNGLTVPQPAESYKYTAMPDCDPTEGPFEETGINEFGVAISATNSADANEEAMKADPFVEEGIGEEHIPTLILPRATSAKQGVEILGEMIEEFGSTSAYGLAIADSDEVWYFEVGSGHHWVASRVPDDMYVVVANGLRISEINLEDTDNYMGTAGIEAFARENKLVEEGAAFDFAKAFGVLGDHYNTRREWWAQKQFTSSIIQSAEEERYPLFMKPDKKLDVKDIMTLLSSRYEGTEYDPALSGNEDERPIGVDYTVESHVIQLRQDMPVEVAGLMWLCVSNPEYGVYLPFHTGITKTPKAYQMGMDSFDLESAYWTYKSLSVLAQTNSTKYGDSIKAYWDTYQNELIKNQSKIDKTAIKLLNANKEEGIDYLNQISNQNALDALEKATQMRNDLITEFAKD